MRREFPRHPLVGVGGVVIHRGRVLLVRRGSEPLKGKWSIPGGLLELGEALEVGTRRELKEETGLDVEPLEVVAVFDRIERRARRVRYHYVIVDYLCRLKGGRLKPASDSLDARWVRPEDLPRYRLTDRTTAVIVQAFACLKNRRRAAKMILSVAHRQDSGGLASRANSSASSGRSARNPSLSR